MCHDMQVCMWRSEDAFCELILLPFFEAGSLLVLCCSFRLASFRLALVSLPPISLEKLLGLQMSVSASSFLCGFQGLGSQVCVQGGSL